MPTKSCSSLGLYETLRLPDPYIIYINVDRTHADVWENPRLPFFMSKVLKKDGQIRMTCKAYNGRCVLEWLAFCLRAATRHHDNDADERLPVAAVCMTLVRRNWI